jgi:hypothetical protein
MGPSRSILKPNRTHTNISRFSQPEAPWASMVVTPHFRPWRMRARLWMTFVSGQILVFGVDIGL